jgi:hypothetical protein
MTRKWRMTGFVSGSVLLVLLAGYAGSIERFRQNRLTHDELRADVVALQAERDALRLRSIALSAKDPRLAAMPTAPVVVGIPTALVRRITERFVTGLIDGATVELRDLEFQKTGSISKVVRIGDYRLTVAVKQTMCRLKAGTPTITFDGNGVSLALPVSVVSSAGHAIVNFKWDSRGLGGAICGDSDFTREVAGTIRPDTYVLSGSFSLVATPTRVLVTPHIPPARIRVRVEPSEKAWAEAQRVIDERSGVCGFVLDRVNALDPVRRRLQRGFTVRLPMDRIHPLALPIGVQPTIRIRGNRVTIDVRIERLIMGPEIIWLGVSVSPAEQAGPGRQPGVRPLPNWRSLGRVPPPAPRGGGV